MKLRSLLLSMLMVFLSMKSFAGVVITTSDQQTVESLIADVFSLSWEGNFKDGNLVINYTDGSKRQIAINSIEGVSFMEDAPDDISLVKGQDTAVRVYDIQGRIVLKEATVGGLGALPKGEYIVKNKDIAIKYLKK